MYVDKVNDNYNELVQILRGSNFQTVLKKFTMIVKSLDSQCVNVHSSLQIAQKLLNEKSPTNSREIEKRMDIECRHVVLGHLQRAGHPTAFDRVLGTRLGVHAAEMVDNKEFGKVAALKGTEIVTVDMKAALGKLKTVPKKRYDEARLFFGVEG